jgi:hypothetical protein
MAGTWTSFNAPNTSTGTFAADIMLLLTDGSVLVHNGYVIGHLGNANQWLRLTPSPTGKYEAGSWSSEINMQFARQWFASGVLNDGRVFVIGGEDCDDPANPSDTPTGEIFDPQANSGVGSWNSLNKPSPAFDFVRGDCNGSVLSDGRVLLGGATPSGLPPTWSKRTAIWDPNDNSWVEAGLQFGALSSTDKEDPFEEETFSLLPDGSVLAPAVRDTPKAQRYVPSLDQWVDCKPSPVNLAVISISGVGVYETGGSILLPSGKTFAVGGTGQTAIFTLGPNPTDPGSWTQGPTFPNDTSATPNWPTLTALDAPTCLLPSGKVVCLAGNAEPTAGDYFSSNPVFLEYDPASTATTLPLLDAQPTLPPLPTGNQTWQSAFLLLPTGQLLCSAQSNTLFLYTPDPASGLPDPSWKPANISVPATLVLNRSYTLSGTQLNGLSQAVCYGDDAGMATNYPIVRLTNTASGEVVYLRSYNFSSMGVATGATVPNDLQSCTIDIPSNFATGNWNLVVIANGIPSDPVSVQTTAAPIIATAIADNGDFGNACLGGFVDEDLTINNTGFSLLLISNIISSSPDFIVASVASYPLAVSPGGFIDIVIRFQPGSLGPKSAAITILSNNLFGPQTINVTGTAQAPRLVLAIADKGNFGQACVGSFVDKPLIVNNSGKCPLSVDNITSSSSEFLIPEVLAYPISIGAGDSLLLPIRFEPASFGAKSTTLTVISNDPIGPRTIQVSGDTPAGKLAVTGSTFFGGVKACCRVERSISICNVGDCKLNVSSVAFKRKSRHWKLINNPFPATLHPGSCLCVAIRYKATEKYPRSCDLIITSDDPIAPAKTLEVVAYTIWSECCRKCCEDCRKGSCERRHCDPCCCKKCHDDYDDGDDGEGVAEQ